SSQGTVVRFTQGRPARAWTAAAVALEPLGWRVVAQQPDAALLRHFHRTAGSFLCLALFVTGLMGTLMLRWAHLHQVTLRVLMEQKELLRDSEQRRIRAALRRGGPSQEQPHAGA
ncbi:MAG TPA: hypothetical protein VJA19_07425, partial [Pseudomonas sp.]|nr:hypothetical protein [Pseudomonas sp.]